MSATPNGKRRRLEQASNALSKPFKSPLRRATPGVKEEAASPKPKIEEIPSTPSTQTAAASEQETCNGESQKFNPSTRKRPFPSQRLAGSKKPILTDPETTTLQKQQRELQSRLANLRSELDTVKQALRIESSNRDDELEGLILKWRKVSQDAAEEVFTGAQERIARMGGVKAWRERMKNDASTKWEQEEMESWFGNVDVDADAEALDEEEVQSRKAEMREVMEKQKLDQEESEEFTMDMMLNTLNVDLKTIGFDKEYQRWNKA
ncbi:hypothetical protein BDV18DRAFT_159670 [Aspergillus unguis]